MSRKSRSAPAEPEHLARLASYGELTEREAAAELRVSTATLQRERAEGKIAYVRRRRRVLYPRESIEDYQKSQIRREVPIPSLEAITSTRSLKGREFKDMVHRLRERWKEEDRTREKRAASLRSPSSRTRKRTDT